MRAMDILYYFGISYLCLFLFILFGMRPLLNKVSCRHGLWWFICKDCKK
jgi:hypothetical protein